MQAADRLLVQTVRRGGGWLAVLAVVSVGGASLQLALPFVLGRTVDDSASWLPTCIVVVAAVVALDGLRVWASGASGAQASAWLRRRTIEHVLGAGPSTTRSFDAGDLVTRTGVNAEEAGRAPEAVVTVATLLIPAVGSVVALVLIDPWLALTLVAGLALITAVLRGFLRQTTTIAGDYQATQADIAARLLDALGGARTIAAAATEDREIRRVLAPLPAVRRHAMGLWRANARAGIQAAVVVPLLEVAVLAVGGWQLSAGDLTVGELYAAARYTLLGAGLGSAVGYVNRLARARAAAGRVSQVLALDVVDYGSRALPPGPGTLELDGVATDALHGMDLVIPGGLAVAVVGASGSGKSLLAALTGRMVDPARGTVRLDGVPLPELSRDALRGAIGYAFERPVLLGEDIADAVGLGLRSPDLAVVEAAAVSACADGFVRRLPGEYATALADAPMSGGERQRLGLARAFAHGERLLILDDATSSLDTVTERQVADALTHGVRRTRLIVAHRVATAAASDRVVWLDAGRVRGYDTHERLWRHAGYRATFRVDE